MDQSRRQPALVKGHREEDRSVDRAVVIGSGLRTIARWSARALLIGLATAGALWILSRLWVGVLPVLLAMTVASVFRWYA